MGGLGGMQQSGKVNAVVGYNQGLGIVEGPSKSLVGSLTETVKTYFDSKRLVGHWEVIIIVKAVNVGIRLLGME
jgi:hypothetical protein